MRILEICVDNYENAVTAADSGADRLEICEDLSVGGVTPAAEVIGSIKKAVSVPVFVLIRSRAGNFQYSTNEIDQMLEDIKTSKQEGADGLVFGALNEKNEVDLNVCQQLLAASSGLPVTFHRAFDGIYDKSKALEDVIKLGFNRILTSGGSDSAETGVDILKNLVSQAGDRIIIMPGGSVNDENISRISQVTNAQEFHSSGRPYLTKHPELPTQKSDKCSVDMIKNMRKILDSTIF